ncbi:period circadian protein homolog 2 isoform X1 [Ornithorhynchus anatinus]|uniref:Period circadian protein homolog 2 n=2 Tax=Ornithorhynchus anatinus TaxID=9258 RepID=F7A850_ORNAN|nr:period circadian protein homolog 2 isoform X1 [Ornithorhynchus anatinus]XP_007669912.2 period circadian protein homolog 2 isoform X1 [Ornithorhynchus anatinus]XP_016083745.2 period circadian protein homolog 2 isoform X1 [Ornithorhynchus anatinus]
MNGYAELSHDPSNLAIDDQMKPRQNQDALQEDIEMSSGSSGNDFSGNEANENYFSGRDSHGNESDENGKDSAMLVETLDSHKSSNAFTLMIANCDHNLSTSGCSSEQSAKAKTQKELIKTLKELKVHLPPDKKTKGKSSTLATLKYALRSIKQVKANEDYYQLLMSNENHPSTLEVSSYTVDEVENITSEYIMKNVDMFAVAVSLVTGKILYISDQAATVLHCKRDTFHNAKFVEFLAPHDVSVFYSSTTPSRLPSLSICRGVESSSQECMEEKSFFCRVSGGKEHENEICYHPFRMTPYLIKAQDKQAAEEQLCCVLLAEKVHSGYEAPRIPPDKRIFTTTHTPSCLFQDVDERAVPLLGYLPQDLVGTPVLLHLHPSDRPLMLAIHKKILQYGGQPFDYSPIRFCTRNGNYITMDTSWSSFINPWSRKVSFIIGRHKVRTGPLNEDVFAVHNCTEEKTLHPSIQEITEQIYRLLLQPVYTSGSSGYGSLGSNGSHEHLMSVTSSSDSNGNVTEDPQKKKLSTLKGSCKDVQMTPNRGQVYIESGAKQEHKNKPPEKQSNAISWTKDGLVIGKDSLGNNLQKNLTAEDLAYKNQPVCSYQQISCLDSVIRYLESCDVAGTMKKKGESFPSAAILNSGAEKQKSTVKAMRQSGEETVLLKAHLNPTLLKPSKAKGRPGVGAHLTSLALPGKAGSVASFTSQCSYSSTIVHVGDKKPQPELEMIEDTSGTEPLDGLTAPPSNCNGNQDKEPFKKLGLTKEILAVHTQKEEQSFLHKFKEIKRFNIFQSRCNYYLQERSKGRASERVTRVLRNGASGIDSSWKKNGKNRKQKSKRMKPHESSDSSISSTNLPHRSPLIGLNTTAWSPSENSQASYPAIPFPSVMPAYSLPVFSAAGNVQGPEIMPPAPSTSQTGFNEPLCSQNNFPMQPPQFATPVAPVLALVMPNYTYPQMNPNLPESFYSSQPDFSGQLGFSSQMMFSAQPQFPVPTPFPSEAVFPPQPLQFNPAESEKPPGIESRDGLSRSTTPQSPVQQGHVSLPLFHSRCSSPLQLNLLQLEETPRTTEKGAAALSGMLAGHRVLSEGPMNKIVKFVDCKRKETPSVDTPMDTHNSDALSMPSDFLDLLLNEDVCSGTGSASTGSAVSAASESLGSGSNVCDLSRSGTGSSETSHTSKYFGSVDSSENNHKVKMITDKEEREHFIKYVLQDPIWLLMANADETVMMTYQIPSRNLEAVLKEDREKLKRMQKFQPKFTEEQKRELNEVHSWIQKGGLPKAVNVSECIYCEDTTKDKIFAPYDEEIHSMEPNEVIETDGEKNVNTLNRVNEEQT